MGENNYDLVLLDLKMPEKDGFFVLNMIIVLLKKGSWSNLFKAHLSIEESGNDVILHLSDALTFCNYLGLKKAIYANLNNNVILDFAKVSYVDHSVKHHLAGLKRDFEIKGLKFVRVNTHELIPINDHHLAEEIAK